MRIDWTYDGCDEHDVPAIEQHWERAQMELEGKLAELSDAPSELRIAVECGEANPAWRIQAALHSPGHTLVAASEAERVETSLDNILHELAAQIDTLEDTPIRVSQRRVGVNGIVSLLQAWHAENRSQAFLSFLAPLVGSLRPYIQREINVRECEETLPGEESDASDVLDEVLVQGWERFGERSTALPFDLWLVQLADEVLNRLSVPVADSSIDDPSPNPPDDALPYEDEAWIEQVSYPETIDMSELLPDGPGVEFWDDLNLEAKQTHLAVMLSTLERDQRQAFVLNVAHGFELEEIADFQARPIDQVSHDIAQAGATIQRWLTDEATPEQEEAFARAELRERRRRSR